MHVWLKIITRTNFSTYIYFHSFLVRALAGKKRRTVFERYFANALSLIPLCSATDNDKNQLKQQQESPFDSPLEVKLPSHKNTALLSQSFYIYESQR